MKQRGLSLRRIGWLVVLLVSLTGLSAGCCSSEPLTSPHLPPGKPIDRTKELRERLSDQDVAADDIDLILLDRLEWKSWALALEKAGRWQGD